MTSSADDLGRRFFAEQDRLRGGPSEALCAETYSAVLGSNPAMTRAHHEQFALAFYAAFPDLRHDVESVIGEGNRIAVRFVLTGTHTGDFFGIPPTSRAIRVPAHVMLEVHGGVVERLSAVFDEAGLLRQLGVLPQ